MIEAVVFDFDGVIANTPEYYFRHMRAYLKRIHAGITDEEVSELVGKSFSEKLAYINEKYSLAIDLAEFVESVSVPAREEMRLKMEPDGGMKRLLREIESAKLPCAIATTNVRNNVDFVLEKFGLKNFFNVIVTVEDVGKYKPSPDVYIRAVKLLGKNAENCVAVEDTMIGVSAAKRAGLKAIALPGVFTSMHDFSEADLVVKSFKELNLRRMEALFA